MKSTCLRVWAALAGILSLGGAVHGQILLSPTAVVGTDLGTFSGEVPLTHLIDQSGLETPFISGTTLFETYFASPNQTFAMNGPANNWQSEADFELPQQGSIDFDLGSVRTVSKLAIWNVSAENITLAFANDPTELASAPLAGSFRLTDHTSFPFSYRVDVITLPTPAQGRYFRLGVQSTYLLSPGLRFSYVILGEVAVSASPATTPTPTLSISQESTGDVVVTFGGTLQAGPSLSGPFEPVPGNPQGTYRVPAANQTSAQFFRAQ